MDDEEKFKKSRSKRKKKSFSSSSSNESIDEEVSRQKNIRKKVVLAQFPEPPKASNFEITTKDTLIKSVDNNAASVSFILPVQTSGSFMCYLTSILFLLDIFFLI